MLNLDKAKGCVYGLAIGDALGFPVEFSPRETIRRIYGPNGVQDFVLHSRGMFNAGTYSDDTQMTLAVARALIDRSVDVSTEYGMDTLMSYMGRQFVDWAKSPSNNRAPGNTCMGGCRNLEYGQSWKESGIPETPGCGSAMRVAPVGLVYHDDEKKLIEVAKNSSIMTHSHPTAVAAAVGAALLTAYAYKQEDPMKMAEKVYDRTVGIDTRFANRLMTAFDLRYTEPDQAFDIIGEGWVGDEAVAGAFYSFLRSPNDYKQTILTSANTTGDSDSFACIAGAISGAYNGIQGIPEKWIKQVENSEYLGKIAQELATL